MKLYRAQLYAVDHAIPYFKRVLCQKDGIVEYYDPMREDKRNTKTVDFTTTYIKNLVVYKGCLGKVVDVTTGRKFPLMKYSQADTTTLTGRSVDLHIYKFTRSNQRLYVLLKNEMTKYELKDFYESLTKEQIQYDDIALQKAIEEETKYWNPIPKRKSTRQYVKMIKQMRKQNGNN